jgi:hypothetical protein
MKGKKGIENSFLRGGMKSRNAAAPITSDVAEVGSVGARLGPQSTR